MKVRARLVVSAVVVAIPLAGFMSAVRTRITRQLPLQIYAGAVQTHMQAGGSAACAADPAGWAPEFDVPLVRSALPGTGYGRAMPEASYARVRLAAVDASLKPAAPGLERLAEPLASALAQGALTASRLASPTVREVVVRQPAPVKPSCAFVLARVTEPPDGVEALFGPPLILIVPPLVVLIAVLVATGSLVRRLRELTRSVRESARQGYAPAVRMEGNDELSELARAFDAAAKEVRDHLAEREARERALRESIENTAHDVAIPLSVLRGHLMAIESTSSGAKAETSEHLRGAAREAHYLGALLQNLTLAANLEAGALAPARVPVELCDLVDRVVQRHRFVARINQVALERAVPAEPLHVLGDVTYLEQALNNVVLNAVRYTPPEGHVAVVLETRGADRFSIRVLDDGPGLDAESLARVTERGQRGAEGRTRAPAGQGLGLHIAQSVARMHGFGLELKPAGERGLEVVLSGPLCASPQVPSSAAQG